MSQVLPIIKERKRTEIKSAMLCVRASSKASEISIGHQFSDGLSNLSMTRVSIFAFVDSSFSPSCSRSALLERRPCHIRHRFARRRVKGVGLGRPLKLEIKPPAQPRSIHNRTWPSGPTRKSACDQGQRSISGASDCHSVRPNLQHHHIAVWGKYPRRRRRIAGRALSMRAKFRPELLWLDQSQRQHGSLLRLKMHSQLETVGQQSLHHQAHLVFRRISFRRFGLNCEAILTDPFRRRLGGSRFGLSAGNVG